MRNFFTTLLFWISFCCACLAAAGAGDLTINGTVVSDLDGYPLARARVTLFAAGNGSLLSSVDTDANGRFEFHVSKVGKYSLLAQKRGYPPQRFDEHEGYSTAIAVGPDKESTGLIYRLKPACSLSGTVTDEAGEAVRDGQVRLFRKAMENGQLTFQSRWGSGLDDRGFFHFANLPAGAYFLEVQARPWYARPARTPYVASGKAGPPSVANPDLDVAFPATYYPGTPEPEGARPITLRPGDRTSVDMTLTAVPALHLQIANVDESAGNVQPALRRKTLGGADTFTFSETNRVSPDRIEITGIAPGNYKIAMESFGPQGGRAQSVRQQAVKVTGDGELDFAKTAAEPSVTGVVTFEGGPKPQQAQISLWNRESNESVGAQVSADGTFEIPSASAGWYDVRVLNIGAFSIKSVSAQGARVAGLRVHLSGSAKLAVTMSAALGSIDGVVKSDGKTFAGAMVVLVPEDQANHPQWFRRDQSDSDGTFGLGQILPGKYTVLAIRDGWDLEWSRPEVLERFLPGGQVVRIEPNGKLNVTVKLQ